jgi:hypothetical protein
MLSFRACGARPSAGRAIQGKMALRWKARGWREGWFPRRGAVSAPEWQGRTKAWVWHDRREVGEGPVAYLGHARVKPILLSAGVRSPPLRGGTIQARMTLRGKARR